MSPQRAPGASAPASDASKFGACPGPVIVILPSWVGDVVMATPALRAIGSLAEGEGRALLALGRPAVAPLLAGLLTSSSTAARPLFGEVIERDARGIAGLARTIGALRATRAASALLLPNSLRTALVTWLARIPSRMGYSTDGRGILLSRTVAARKPRSPVCTVDWYVDLVERLFAIEVHDRRPRLALTPSERAEAERLLADVPRPFVLLNPGANRADKRWPADRFAALGTRLRQRHGLAIAITGSPQERELASAVASRCEGAVDLAARQIGLAALKGVVAEAAVVVTNDTGPRHIAIGLDTPVVALFGPTDHRWTAIPGVRERRLLAEPFLPAEFHSDQHARECAIDRIAVSDAETAVAALIADTERRTGAIAPLPYHRNP